MNGIRWTPLFLGAGICAAIVGVSWYASERVRSFLRPAAERIRPVVLPPEIPEVRLPDPESRPAAGEAEDTGGPMVDLDHPSERDWRFLLDVMEEGPHPARLSAAKVLVQIGDLRGVAPLFARAVEGGEDADLFCYAALEILRMQRREDSLAAMMQALVEPGPRLDLQCRSELSDRFTLVGGKDPETLVELAEHPDPGVRTHVAAYLGSLDPAAWEGTLRTLAEDPDTGVRQRARHALETLKSADSPEPPEDE